MAMNVPNKLNSELFIDRMANFETWGYYLIVIGWLDSKRGIFHSGSFLF